MGDVGAAPRSRGGYVPALGFHPLTPLYDPVLTLLGLGPAFQSRVVDLLGVQAGEKVLDVGCGTGTLLGQLVERQPDGRYAGVDPDAAALHVGARKLAGHGIRATLIRAYAQALPFGDRSFDAVVTTLVFHHLPDPVKRAALQEVRRVLRPSGRFLLVDFGPPTSRTSKVLLTLARLFEGPGLRANLAGELPAMLHAAGLTGVAQPQPVKWGIHCLAASPCEQPPPAGLSNDDSVELWSGRRLLAWTRGRGVRIAFPGKAVGNVSQAGPEVYTTHARRSP